MSMVKRMIYYIVITLLCVFTSAGISLYTLYFSHELVRAWCGPVGLWHRPFHLFIFMCHWCALPWVLGWWMDKWYTRGMSRPSRLTAKKSPDRRRLWQVSWLMMLAVIGIGVGLASVLLIWYVIGFIVWSSMRAINHPLTLLPGVYYVAVLMLSTVCVGKAWGTFNRLRTKLVLDEEVSLCGSI